MSRTKFEGIEELEDRIMNLDVAGTRDVYIDANNSGYPTKTSKFTAILNISKGNPEAVVSKQYTIVQHKDAFMPVVMGARAMSGDPYGFISDEGGKVYLDVLFKDQRFVIKPNDNEPIALGLRFSNSYDGTGAMTGKAFGFRQVCSNGMIMPTTVFAHAYKIHRGAMSVDMFRNLMLKVAEIGPALNVTISEAMKDIIEQNMIDEVLNKVGIGKRYRAQLMSKAFELAKINRWDLYNVLTDFISNEIKAETEFTKERYHGKANLLLTQPIMEIVKRKGQ